MSIYSLSGDKALIDLVRGGGLTRSIPQNTLAINQAWTLHNLIPTVKGFTNENIGFSSKLNIEENAPKKKIQAGFVFKNKQYFIRDGNFYQMPLNGGVPILIETGAFSKKNRIRHVFAMGSGLQKVYLVDGENNLRSWDGNTLSQVNLPEGFDRPDKLITWRGRLVLGFPKESVNENRLLFSKTENADNYTDSNGSIIDPFSDYVSPGDGDYINGIACIKIKNAAAQSEMLLVAKTRQTYQADELNINGSVIEATFNRLALDLGVINPDCIVNFSNDVYLLNSQGVGGFSSATASGGVDVLTYSNSLPVNELIRNASSSSAFKNSLAVHLPSKQMILFFVPESSATATEQYDFTYEELPLDFAICLKYGYGVGETGEALNSWFTMGGAGFAISSAWTDNEDNLYLGTHLGNIFKAFSGNSFEEERIIQSVYETGDLFSDSLNQRKSLQNINFHLALRRPVKATCKIYFDGKNNPDFILSKFSSNVNLESLVWGFARWGSSIWVGEILSQLTFNPVGIGSNIRLNLSFDSKIIDEISKEMRDNYVYLFGLSGSIKIGNKRQIN